MDSKEQTLFLVNIKYYLFIIIAIKLKQNKIYY
jgi:hypothetical protein